MMCPGWSPCSATMVPRAKPTMKTTTTVEIKTLSFRGEGLTQLNCLLSSSWSRLFIETPLLVQNCCDVVILKALKKSKINGSLFSFPFHCMPRIAPIQAVWPQPVTCGAPALDADAHLSIATQRVCDGSRLVASVIQGLAAEEKN